MNAWPSLARVRFTLHRLFGVVLLGCAGTWVWAVVMLQRQIKADNLYYTTHVAPYLEQTKRVGDDPRSGGTNPGGSLATYHPIRLDPLNQWMARQHQGWRLRSIKLNAELGFMFTLAAWAVAAQVQAGRRRKQWASPERPAAPEAGALIKDFVEKGQTLVAKTSDSIIKLRKGAGPEVHVNGATGWVVFRRFTFIKAFVGNRKTECTELRFEDILGGDLLYDKGRCFLHLRTTAGKVTITDKLRPFDTLAGVLLDIAELNRTSPERYRAALAREPVVRTPWYGWLIILLACAAVVGAFWWVTRDSQRLSRPGSGEFSPTHFHP